MPKKKRDDELTGGLEDEVEGAAEMADEEDDLIEIGEDDDDLLEGGLDETKDKDEEEGNY